MGDWNIFALICGEINVLPGRDSPQYVSAAAEAAIIAPDVVINATNDRMSKAGTLDAKCRMLSRASDDGCNRVYVSCSTGKRAVTTGGASRSRPQRCTRSTWGEAISGEEYADGAFGFVYRHWTLAL